MDDLLNHACSNASYDNLLKYSNKGADKTVLMRRLVCTFVVRMEQIRDSSDETLIISYWYISLLLILGNC